MVYFLLSFLWYIKSTIKIIVSIVSYPMLWLDKASPHIITSLCQWDLVTINIKGNPEQKDFIEMLGENSTWQGKHITKSYSATYFPWATNWNCLQRGRWKLIFNKYLGQGFQKMSSHLICTSLGSNYNDPNFTEGKFSL